MNGVDEYGMSATYSFFTILLLPSPLLSLSPSSSSPSSPSVSFFFFFSHLPACCISSIHSILHGHYLELPSPHTLQSDAHTDMWVNTHPVIEGVKSYLDIVISHSLFLPLHLSSSSPSSCSCSSSSSSFSSSSSSSTFSPFLSSTQPHPNIRLPSTSLSLSFSLSFSLFHLILTSYPVN